jgi:prolyl oligopeptidase
LYRQPSLEAKAEVFFDPNTLTADGTGALNTYAFSESGKHFAYGVSYSGSDWVKVMVKSAATTPVEHGDTLEWAKFTSLSWTHDDAGFFYSRYPQPNGVADAGTETDANINGMLYYHRMGTPQSDDVLVLKDAENPTHMFGAEVTDDGLYAVVTVTEVREDGLS